MLKRLPFLCAALLALAACSHDSDSGSAAQQAAPAVTSSAETAPARNETRRRRQPQRTMIESAKR